MRVAGDDQIQLWGAWHFGVCPPALITYPQRSLVYGRMDGKRRVEPLFSLSPHPPLPCPPPNPNGRRPDPDVGGLAFRGLPPACATHTAESKEISGTAREKIIHKTSDDQIQLWGAWHFGVCPLPVPPTPRNPKGFCERPIR